MDNIDKINQINNLFNSVNNNKKKLREQKNNEEIFNKQLKEIIYAKEKLIAEKFVLANELDFLRVS